MILKYLSISHLDIWNHRCQATNLAGSSEQTTPVTVRHAGESYVQWPMSKVQCQFKDPNSKVKCPKLKSNVQCQRINFKDPNSKVQCSIAVSWMLMVHCFTTLIRPARVFFSKQFFGAKAWGTSPFFTYSITLIEAIWLLWNDCCAFMVSVLQWQRTTPPPVVPSTTTVWTAATALTTSPLASWSAGNAKWSDTVAFGNLLRSAKAQTNFIASYIHLDAHCLASSDELEPLEIYIHTQPVTSSG